MIMKTWFTADTHFGHGNIIKYCNRPFLTDAERDEVRRDPRGPLRLSPETVDRHDAALLDAINSRVAEDDTLWILGDFCWGKLPEAKAYRDRIRCRNVHLVWGNHDHRSIRLAFAEAIEQGMIEVEGQSIWLNHYPMRSWDGSFHGSWQLYGHVHGRLTKQDESDGGTLTKDVGVDACDYRPWSFEDLFAYMAPRIEKFNQRKAAFLEGGDVEVTL
jgi:calcineurin-like phosphoesterase family protein